MVQFNIGDRVKLKNNNSGIIRFIGTTSFQAGEWIGIELDVAAGKNDGSINSVRYFQCEDNFGIFARPTMVSLLDDNNLISPSSSSLSNSRPHSSLSTTNSHNDEKTFKLEIIVQRLEFKLKNLRKELMESKQKIEELTELNDNLTNSNYILHENIEHETIEKEVTMEEKHNLSIELNRVTEEYQNMKTEFEKLREELKLHQDIEDEIIIEAISQDKDSSLVKKIKLTELALIKLKESSSEREKELVNKLQILENDNTNLKNFEKNCLNYEKKLDELKETNENLKEKLNSLSDSESLIENLTDKNTELLNKISELENSVKELEQLHELDQDLERNFNELQTEFEADINNLKIELDEKRSKIEELMRLNQYLEQTIIKLNTNDKLKDKDLKSTESNSVAIDKHTDKDDRIKNLNEQIEFQKLINRTYESVTKDYLKIFGEFFSYDDDDDSNEESKPKLIQLLSVIVTIKYLSLEFSDFFKKKYEKASLSITSSTFNDCEMYLDNYFALINVSTYMKHYSKLLPYFKLNKSSCTEFIKSGEEFINKFELIFSNDNFKAIEKNLSHKNLFLIDEISDFFNHEESFLNFELEASIKLTHLKLLLDLYLKGVNLINNSEIFNRTFIENIETLKSKVTNVSEIIKTRMVMIDNGDDNNSQYEIPEKIYHIVSFDKLSECAKELNFHIYKLVNYPGSHDTEELTQFIDNCVFGSDFDNQLLAFDNLYESIDKMSIIKTVNSAADMKYIWKVSSGSGNNNNTIKSIVENEDINESFKKLTEDLKSKDEENEELKLKLSILHAKIEKNKKDKETINEITENLNKLTTENTIFKNRVNRLRKEITEKDKDLSILKNSNRIFGGNFANLFEEKQFFDKADLISQAGYLSQAIAKYEMKTDKLYGQDYSWLCDSQSETNDKKINSVKFSNDLKRVTSDLINMSENFKVVPIRTNYKWKPKKEVLQYYVGSMKEKYSSYKNSKNEFLEFKY
ncbi:hypothetical protein B5S30_g1102 [[Candida] boidinii]|nr:hypothetical protein B5S30_g1102 [[Candida] boidinii]